MTSHMIFPRHAQFVTTVATQERFFESLSPPRRSMVNEVVGELQPRIFDVQRRFNEERLERILERKPETVIVELTEEERARFRERSLPVRETFVEEVGPRGGQALEALVEAIERAEGGVSGSCWLRCAAYRRRSVGLPSTASGTRSWSRAAASSTARIPGSFDIKVAICTVS